MSFQIDKSKLYQKLFQSFTKSHTNTKVQNIQKLVNEVWRNYKLPAKSDKELDVIVSKRIEEELQGATRNKSSLLSFFPRSQRDEGENVPPEWAIIELQGVLQAKQGNELHGKVAGHLHYTKKSGQPILILGHHVLTGRETKLEHPMAVLEKVKMDSKTEYGIAAIIKKKLIFKSRPKPIISNVAVSV